MKNVSFFKWLSLAFLTPFISNAQSLQKGLNGVEYTVFSAGGTQQVKEKLYVFMHLILKVANDQTDSLIIDSDDVDQSEIRPLSYNGMPDELTAILNKAKSGDSLSIKLPLEVMIPDATERAEYVTRWNHVLCLLKIRGVYRSKSEANKAIRKWNISNNKSSNKNNTPKNNRSKNRADSRDLPTPPPPPPPPGKKSLRSQSTDARLGDIDESQIFEKVETDAYFPGNWMSYLMEHLNADLPSINKAPAGSYTVIVQFIVDKKGKISDVKAMNDPGYGLAKEAVRVIKASGRWSPGQQNGKPVTCYKRQPITWVVE